MFDDIEKHVALKYHPIKYIPAKSEILDLLLNELESVFTKNGQQINHYNLPQRLKIKTID
jgi:hypothetical protein